MKATKVPVILVVDDDMATRKLLVDVLRDDGCFVVEAADGAEAFDHVQEFMLDMIVTDLKMHLGGFEYLRQLKKVLPDCPVIVMTAFGDSQSKRRALECGVLAYFEKPMRIGDLKNTIWEALGWPDTQTSSQVGEQKHDV